MTTTKVRGEILRQVLLERPVEGGVKRDVFWIDNKLARVGKRVVDGSALGNRRQLAELRTEHAEFFHAAPETIPIHQCPPSVLANSDQTSICRLTSAKSFAP